MTPPMYVGISKYLWTTPVCMLCVVCVLSFFGHAQGGHAGLSVAGGERRCRFSFRGVVTCMPLLYPRDVRLEANSPCSRRLN